MKFPGPVPTAAMLPMKNLKFARAYILDQPYVYVATPEEGLRHHTIFPYLLNAYLPGLKKAEKKGDKR